MPNPPRFPPPSAWKPLLRLALKEDLGRAGDLTTKFFVPAKTRLAGTIVAKQEGVVCGLPLAAAVFKALSPRIAAEPLVAEGARVTPGTAVMSVSGGREILTAERTALNFLQRMSGVATLTARYAALVAGTRTRICDTRKTLPGWRLLDKYAVLCGGGANHRIGLYDMVLLKDNHWATGADVPAGVRQAKRRHKVRVEIEADDLEQVKRALAAGADIVLLDNMSPERAREAIALIRREKPGVEIELSGGVSFETLPELAKLGADRISVGRLTHSAPALDLSLEIT